MFKIEIDDVMPGTVLEQDIFSENNRALPLLCAGKRITAGFLYQLKKRGVTVLYTSSPVFFNKKGPSQTRSAINPIASTYVKKSRSIIAPKTKDEALKTMKNLEISLNGLDADDVFEVVNSLDSLLNRILDEFPTNLTAPINIHHLRGQEKDPFIYKHSLSVAVISMAIGQYLSLPPDDVLRLGKCASMHDTGMFLIPADIVHKEEALSRDELENIKRHTLLGYRCLVKMGVADESMCDGMLYHHERVNGTGYPSGIKGEKIPLWSRIIAVADVYDAMTSHRPHRKAFTPAEACEYIMANASISFDYDIAIALLRRIEFYPVGICVKLSNGDHAIVIENAKSQLRPVVRVMNTDIVLDLNDRKYISLTILGAVSYQDLIGRR